MNSRTFNSFQQLVSSTQAGASNRFTNNAKTFSPTDAEIREVAIALFQNEELREQLIPGSKYEISLTTVLNTLTRGLKDGTLTAYEWSDLKRKVL